MALWTQPVTITAFKDEKDARGRRAERRAPSEYGDLRCEDCPADGPNSPYDPAYWG